MLFSTVVIFIAYSIVYFIVSQRKMKRLRNNIVTLNANLQEKNALLQKAKTQKTPMAVH
ncbi:MAG: hypothetical protein JNK79_18590 [Chitinophagaceae bacterium]|nr:hypothetical protein [Chitinophagaceae bacterium]